MHPTKTLHVFAGTPDRCAISRGLRTDSALTRLRCSLAHAEHCKAEVRQFLEWTSARSRSIAEVSRTQLPRPSPRGGRLLPVGRFFGVPLYFAPSWILIAALITATYGGVVYDAVDGLTRSVSYLVAFAFAVPSRCACCCTNSATSRSA